MLLFERWLSWAELIKRIRYSTWGFGRFQRVSVKNSLLQRPTVSTPTYDRWQKLLKHVDPVQIHLPHFPDIIIPFKVVAVCSCTNQHPVPDPVQLHQQLRETFSQLYGVYFQMHHSSQFHWEFTWFRLESISRGYTRKNTPSIEACSHVNPSQVCNFNSAFYPKLLITLPAWNLQPQKAPQMFSLEKSWLIW